MKNSRPMRASWLASIGIAVLVCGSGASAALADTALPVEPEPSSAASDYPPPATEEELQAEIAQITDPATREIAEDILDEMLEETDAIYGLTVVPYEPVAGETSTDVSARALPAGCGMGVAITRQGNTIQNWTTSSCSSGNWSTVQHAMRIVATHPFTFQQWTVRTSTSTHGAAASYGSAIGYGCVNTNLTNWSVNTKGYMNKGGVNYETPYVTDSFGLSQHCGR